jgi:hypothetical protein
MNQAVEFENKQRLKLGTSSGELLIFKRNLYKNIPPQMNKNPANPEDV